MYNKSIIGESVQQTKTDKASDVIIANENKIEKEKRESIQKAIAEVIDKLKSVYSKY